MTVLRSPAAVCVFDNVRQRTCQLQGPLAINSGWVRFIFLYLTETRLQIEMCVLRYSRDVTNIRIRIRINRYEADGDANV